MSFKKKEGYGMKKNNMDVDKFFEQNLLETQNVKTKNTKNGKKKNRKIFAVGLISIILAGVTVLSAIIYKKLNSNKDKDKTSTQSTTQETTIPAFKQEEPVFLHDLGFAYSNPTLTQAKPQYGNTTGSVDKNKITEQGGTNWKDQEGADKSSQVGTVVTDDKNGTLEVKPNGDVFEKEDGYEVKDENGNIVETGSNESGIPDGYAWDDVLGKLVLEQEIGKYVYADADYYNENGELMLAKGEIVLKVRLEAAKQELTTTKPEVNTQETTTETTVPETTVPETTVPEETISSEEGIINPDGTYTIYGVTYMSKEDYEQFLLYPEQYGYYNGMVLSLEDIEALFQESQKTK